MPSGTAVYVANASGVQQLYQVSSGSTITLNVTGGTGTWSLKLAQYGKVSQSFTFTPSSGGTFSYSPTLLADSNITQATQSTVAAYTTLANTDQVYDYAAYYETTNTGIVYSRIASKQAGYVSLGSYNVSLVSSGSPIVVSGSSVTLNSTSFSIGSTFTTGLVTTGTISVGSATLNYPVLLNGSAGQNYWLSLTLPSATSIYIANASGVQQVYVASSGTSYVYGLPAATSGSWTLSVAKYGYLPQSTTFSPSIGGVDSKTVSFVVDTYVVDTLSNVIAYTDLSSTQKIYDYSSYYCTTNAGIIVGTVMTKGFGTLTIPAGLTLNPSASSLFAVSSGIVTTKTSGLSETVTILSSGNFTQGAATLSNSVTIRASNLDSEIVFVATSITLYPTSTDRDTNSNAGPTSTTGIIRFKYGSVISGVTMSGNGYLRINSGIILFSDITISQGYNMLDYGTTGQLTIINSKVDALPSTTWSYTERTLNKALFK